MSNILVAPATASPPGRDNVLNRLSQWVGAGRPPTNGQIGASAHAAHLTDETLDLIGADNEEIKNRCIDVIRKIDDLTAIRANFVEISDWIGQILAAREQTNAALVERAMMIALAEGALADLKTETRALYECKEEVLAENSLLRSENERLKGSVRGREARIESVESELHEVTDAASRLQQEIELERDRLAHVEGELESAQGVIEKNDALISQLQVDLAAARDQTVFAQQHADMLHANLVESQENAAKLQSANAEGQIYASGLADNIREMEISLEAERRQLSMLDELLATTQSEHLKAQTRWQQEKEQDRGAIAELERQVDKLTAHAQAGDRLLVEVRAELQTKIDEFRAEERRAQEIEEKFRRLNDHAESGAADAAQLKQKLENRERAHARLMRRAKGLIRAMRDLTTVLDKSEQKAQLAGERLTAETKRYEERGERLEQTIHDLTEQLEKERLSNMMTAGALEAARQQRLQPREEVKLADILARAEEAHNAAEREAAGGKDPSDGPAVRR